MTDEGQEGKDSRRDRRTWPAITDFYCCVLAGLWVVVAALVAAVLVFWYAGRGNATPIAIPGGARGSTAA